MVFIDVVLTYRVVHFYTQIIRVEVEDPEVDSLHLFSQLLAVGFHY